MSSLLVSEMFYSIQGEGRYAGTPAVFLRLQHCNLLCEWPCDTIDVWRQGSQYTMHDLQQYFQENEWNCLLESGHAHLVITGGEPLLQRDSLEEFVMMYGRSVIEIETNATILPSIKMDRNIRQYNLSPKLSNSGIPKEKRYKPRVVEYFASTSKTDFKFVVTQEKDIEEIMTDFVTPFSILNDHVFLMPASTTREELEKLSRMVIEMWKATGFRFSSRLQLVVYDKKTGV